MRIMLAALTTFFLVLFTQTGAAHAEVSEHSCSMTSEGIYNGAWVKHRIVSGEQVLFGANEMEAIFSQLDSLRAQGLCR